ncbi:hypothetical protein BDR03DRAFT_936337 [Suillus americanus]|nr:hypothetical protein BDR03DRAFT_936337 [Suillus americanus]
MLNRLLCSYPGWTKHIRTKLASGTVHSHKHHEPDIPEFGDELGGFEGGFANFKPFDPPFDPEHEPQQPNAGIVTHPYLQGDPCDVNGVSLPAGTLPLPRFAEEPGDWAPFTDQAQFLLADFLFCKVEMSVLNIDFLMELWAFKAAKYKEDSPFKSHHDVYVTIDTIHAGDVPWQCFMVSSQEDLPSDAPSWKQHEYQVWYRDPDIVIKNMLDNPDFDGQFDYAPYTQYDKDGRRQWKNFMSGNYAWHKSDKIHTEDDTSNGAMYCGIILGSDKTTMSVATGHVEYHPLYLSIGNPHNLIHSILRPLQHGMMMPVVRWCPDGHYCRVIYDLGAFIADYPEQVMLAGIVQNWCAKYVQFSYDLDDSPAEHCTQKYTNVLAETLPSTQLWDQYGIDDDIVPLTNDFPRADIHEMLTPDLLHQTCKYLTETYGEARANEMLDDIDRHITATPSFPGLSHFPHGHHFKQWTGDDSKALMKVYIPAIVDYVPVEMVQCMSEFLDFYYLVRCSELGEETPQDIKMALQQFHETWEIFQDSHGCPNGFSLPRQHSLVHYFWLIQEFGAPNGLCSSITESRHIMAVKHPWCRSNRFKALGQMLLTNQRLDKLGAARVQLVAHGMLPAAYSPPSKPNLTTDIAIIDSFVVLARHPQRGYLRNLHDLAAHLHEPNLELLICHFLFNQLHMSNIAVFHSAIATFLAPSDVSGTHGMYHEIICSMLLWRQQYLRHNCVFIVADEMKSGMRGMIVGRVKLFFSFMHDGVTYSCALVDCFSHMG